MLLFYVKRFHFIGSDPIPSKPYSPPSNIGSTDNNRHDEPPKVYPSIPINPSNPSSGNRDNPYGFNPNRDSLPSGNRDPYNGNRDTDGLRGGSNDPYGNRGSSDPFGGNRNPSGNRDSDPYGNRDRDRQGNRDKDSNNEFYFIRIDKESFIKYTIFRKVSCIFTVFFSA